MEVTSVANLNQGYWGSETSSSGTITSKANQEVHLDSNNVINQVYVKEGDKVKVGDKLLSYDTTLLELKSGNPTSWKENPSNWRSREQKRISRS